MQMYGINGQRLKALCYVKTAVLASDSTCKKRKNFIFLSIGLLSINVKLKYLMEIDLRV